MNDSEVSVVDLTILNVHLSDVRLEYDEIYSENQ